MRKRTVFPTDEIPHLWAHQTQDEARNSGGNLFFEGCTIYSYGRHFPIATLLPEQRAVLINPSSYSNTTNKHQSRVRYAIHGLDLRRLYVPNQSATVGGYAGYHRENLRFLLKNLEEYKQKQIRSRSIDYTSEAHKMAARVDEYLAVFPDAAAELLSPYHEYGERTLTIGERCEQARSWELSEAVAEAFNKRLNAQRNRPEPVRLGYWERQEKQAAKEVEAKEKFFGPRGRGTKWLAGLIQDLKGNEQRWLEENHGIRLQLVDEGTQVHTTKGAYVPAADARKLLRLVRLTKLAGKGERPMGVSVGHYYVNSITAEGNLIAGCHTIQNAEIERFAASVGWSEAHDEAMLLKEMGIALS